MEVSLIKLKQSMTAQQNRSGVVSNNLANQNTIGYKKDITFFDLLNAKKAEDITLRVATDFDKGVMKQTKNPLDLAISENGFFTVETDYGEAYTRDGHFRLDAEGVLRNSAGMPVLGEDGWIVFDTNFATPKDINISADGEIYLDGKLVDRLKIVSFESNAELEKIGGNLFRAKPAAMQVDLENPGIQQGFLENSNVNPIEEMMNLIEIQRQFESSQRMVRSLDEVYRNAVNQVGKYR